MKELIIFIIIWIYFLTRYFICKGIAEELFYYGSLKEYIYLPSILNMALKHHNKWTKRRWVKWIKNIKNCNIKWVESKNSLPNNGRDVLVVLPSGHVNRACYSGGEWYNGTYYSKNSISYWADFPDPPVDSTP